MSKKDVYDIIGSLLVLFIIALIILGGPYLIITDIIQDRDARTTCLLAGYPTTIRADGGKYYFCQKLVENTEIICELEQVKAGACESE